MNIIEALQALKDGKKIRINSMNKREYYYLAKSGAILLGVDNECGELGKVLIESIDVGNVLTDEYFLYTEPIKITEEERKALKLAKECGFKWINKTRASAWLEVYPQYHDSVQAILARWSPTLEIIEHCSEIPLGWTKIDDLLKEG